MHIACCLSLTGLARANIWLGEGALLQCRVEETKLPFLWPPSPWIWSCSAQGWWIMANKTKEDNSVCWQTSWLFLYEKIGPIVLGENSCETYKPFVACSPITWKVGEEGSIHEWRHSVKWTRDRLRCVSQVIVILSHVQGGPCGVLACVQAHVLKYLLFSDSAKNHSSRLVNVCTFHIMITLSLIDVMLCTVTHCTEYHWSWDMYIKPILLYHWAMMSLDHTF